jgi:1,4-alpha-glucan branching enzyme
MLQRFLFLILFLNFLATGSAQITTSPDLPTASQPVLITFNSAQESRLGYFTGDLYAHTGLIIEGKTGWQHVVGNWGNETNQPKLTYLGNGIYQLSINPDIKTFYSVPSGEKIKQMAFVFRTADESKQTNDLFVTVYEEGLVVKITEPAASTVLEKNQPVTVSASSSVDAGLKLFVNNILLTQTTGKNISATYTFTESGNNWLIAEATAGNETKTDSLLVFIREDGILENKPASYKKGINYPTDTSAALVLWAPHKNFIFVLGDFNNWQPDNNFQMKKDGDFFWLEIPDLQKGKEYLFQYFIDGEIKIADPYSEKIVDPWNDTYISAETYPGLIPYPAGKTEGIASVLQPGQEEFQWEVAGFQVPHKNKLAIYELLIRDFTDEHSYKAVREKLDYLEDLNINVLELMPVNEFEGNSSWGYNPSFYFAPDKYYGPKNELKKLIDECHKRGIAVVIDMVLNHSYGQSPLVQMYMNNWAITDENPWYNKESNFKNPSLTWGYDFNHESEFTKELVDSVNSFWMNEYKIDGFRFDFTKGFSNTPYGTSSWGSEYDAPRIANLKRMANEIWKRKPGALVILEHLSDNPEEKELANHGMMLWGNMHGNYREAAKGNTGGSDLSGSIYSSRGWNEPNLIAYPESHDEERIMVECLNSGLSSGSYNTKQLSTALDRMELISVFHLLLPGPKMIWQFGERGYDLSINRCEDGSVSYDCRLSPKPPRWDYLENDNRTDLFQVMAKLNHLKQTADEIQTGNFSSSLTGAVKWIRYSSGNQHLFAMGNFGTQSSTFNFTFPNAGKWYRYFTKDSVDLATAGQVLTFAPGEYRIYSTRRIEQPGVITDITEQTTDNGQILIYPNPVQKELTIYSGKAFSQVTIYSSAGKLVAEFCSFSENRKTIPVENFSPGIYLVRIVQDKNIVTKKIMVD